MPGLAKDNETMGLSSEVVEVYVNQAAKYQNEFIESLAVKLCPEHTLDKEIFVAQINVYSKISYSAGFRQLLREFIKP